MEDNIRIDLREIGWEGVVCVHPAQDTDQWCTLFNMIMNLQVQKKVGSFLTGRVTIRFSRILSHGVS
jgi:hypothetical protein